MRVRKQKGIVRKGKAALALRRKIGWTRAEWVTEVESALVETFLLFAQAKLGGRNGRRRDARASMAEFERKLFARIVEVHLHPVKDEFDRDQAFKQGVAEMRANSIPALREHVEGKFGEVCGPRRRLDDRDVAEFWNRVREATRVLTG